MNKRTIIAIVIAFTVMLGVSAMWSAETTGRDGDTDANVISDAGSSTGKSEAKEKKGGGIGRIFKAPFKAVGKLLGMGKDDGKIQRLTEKDVARFESAGVSRVDDSRTNDKEKQARAGGDARGHLTQGRQLLSSGRLNEAIAELTTATSLDPRLAEAFNLLGIAYDQKGMHERAKDAYEKSLKGEPQDAQTLNNLGYSLYQNGNYRAAVDKLKKAARLSPTDERILNNLALAQCRLGKYEDAYKNFARAGGEYTGRVNTATLLERMGRDEEAITYYEAARKTQPKSTSVLTRLADLYQRTGKPGEAENARRALQEIGVETTASK